jgi:hypothetical protein
LSKEKVPMKVVVPIIVVTWILSLVSALAIVTVMPSLLGIKSEVGSGSITSSKLADSAVITVKLADKNVTSAKILDGTITALDLADGSIITVKIADGAVTSPKLAVDAIPYKVSHATTVEGTNSTSWVDMPDMSVDITVTRNSTLIIMFSGQVGFVGPGPYGYWIQALINGAPTATAVLTTASLLLDTRSYAFYGPACVVVPGSYTIKIQYATYDVGTVVGAVDRTLTVIALPA